MRLASIILKIPAILLGTVPFTLIGFFFLCGGPDPRAGGFYNPLNLIGVPFLVFACFWALPNRVLLKGRVGIGISILCYGIPIVLTWGFFNWLITTTEDKSRFPSDLTEFRVIVVGIACAALSYFLARKAGQKASEHRQE